MEVKVTEESTMEAKLAEVGAKLDKLAKQASEVKQLALKKAQELKDTEEHGEKKRRRSL